MGLPIDCDIRGRGVLWGVTAHSGAFLWGSWWSGVMQPPVVLRSRSWGPRCSWGHQNLKTNPVSPLCPHGTLSQALPVGTVGFSGHAPVSLLCSADSEQDGMAPAAAAPLPPGSR